jgi:hypothetical protein
MENKIFENLKNKDITTSTLNLYIKNLMRLNDGFEIKNFNFLKDVDQIMKKLEVYKPNTKRSYIISIVSLLKQEPKLKVLYQKYYKILMEFNNKSKINNDKSEQQEKNWLDQSEIKKIFENLKEQTDKFKDNKIWSENEFNQYLNYLLLSLYFLQSPRRNKDYQYCLIYKKQQPNLLNEYNYLDLTNDKFIFNNFKTKKTYKQQEVQLNEDLKNIIEIWLKHHPNKLELKKKNGFVYLLVDFEGNPFKNNNSITRILNKIFDKKIGCSLLRSIYLTDKYSDNLQELKLDATKMGTSSNTIENQYIKLENKI